MKLDLFSQIVCQEVSKIHVGLHGFGTVYLLCFVCICVFYWTPFFSDFSYYFATDIGCHCYLGPSLDLFQAFVWYFLTLYILCQTRVLVNFYQI